MKLRPEVFIQVLESRVRSQLVSVKASFPSRPPRTMRSFNASAFLKVGEAFGSCGRRTERPARLPATDAAEDEQVEEVHAPARFMFRRHSKTKAEAAIADGRAP